MNIGTSGFKIIRASGRGRIVSHHLCRFLRDTCQPVCSRRYSPDSRKPISSGTSDCGHVSFTGSVWSFRGPAQHDNMYRPLQFITYWALYRLAGPNPVIFHLASCSFMPPPVWLVFRLACDLLPNTLAAFAGSLLWALHPLHVETVAWISALPDLGAAFFYLLGFLLFVRAEQNGRPGDGPLHLLAATGLLSRPVLQGNGAQLPAPHFGLLVLLSRKSLLEEQAPSLDVVRRRRGGLLWPSALRCWAAFPRRPIC